LGSGAPDARLISASRSDLVAQLFRLRLNGREVQSDVTDGREQLGGL